MPNNNTAPALQSKHGRICTQEYSQTTRYRGVHKRLLDPLLAEGC
jgi:hypothetical protein